MTECKWTDQFLDEMRLQRDPLGDAAVAALFQNNEIDGVNSLWDILLRNDQIPQTGLHPEIYDYLEKSAAFPIWADYRLIEQGENFFAEKGLFCLTGLLCASLPECYLMEKGAQVLVTTHQLEEHVYRRLFETAQMVVAVMSPGGLAEKGGGVRSAQKVRLMHAAIRNLILQKPPQNSSAPPKNYAEALQSMSWDISSLGYPINQEDMAYTLLTFSYVILRALQDLCVEVTPDEKTACLHCWNVVGYILGVREDMLAHTFAEAERLFLKIKERQARPSEAGQALTHALVTGTGKIFVRYTKALLSKRLAKHISPLLMRQLLSKNTLAILKLKRLTVFEWIALKLLRFLEIVAVRLYQKWIRRAGIQFGLMLIKHLTEMPRGGNRRLFHIPAKLRIAWNVESEVNPHLPH